MNWSLVSGLGLSVIAFLSYFTLFTRWPLTRDVPWASFALFAAAIALLIKGLRSSQRKIIASIALVAGIAIAVLFTFFILKTRSLPVASHAPAVGTKAPDFTLTDSKGKRVSLSELLAKNSVLLIFYRGHW